MNLERRRQRIAQLLLSVFIPVLLLTITHHHTMVEKPAAPCILCLHHVPHSDLSSGAMLALQHCVICHFSTIPYILPVLAGLLAVAFSYFILSFWCRVDYCFVFSPFHRSRAPPYFLF
ncbi:MAG: hypothetical protein LKF48_06775 [Prevotella sp.]|nr:hypothetical protein [Prevotella sp.]MCH4182845.1 hypothetical protein [Prevotella sp.]MCH4211491.1 hypothetical protein [Prevotella sp.]MCH4240795.1 hypothetical protein [Prevotella sp.]MCI1741070.1 hypothetical protein [Prevotella sp.]